MTTDTILSTTLASILQQLADFFGMTTEVIIQNAPYWLARYGWFSAAQNLQPIVIALAFPIFVIALLTFAIQCDLGVGKNIKLKHFIILYFTSVFIGTIINFVPCAIAPEIYGLNALLKLLK